MDQKPARVIKKKLTPTYSTWRNMRYRCENPRRQEYKDYGARGITVCERWQSFDSFYSDMGERPDGMSLDRIDNNKGYFPENCRWATQKQQIHNSRIARQIEYHGLTMPICEWAKFFGVSYGRIRTLLYRYKDVNMVFDRF